MPAVVTDKFRIDNASNFIDSVNSNNYYVFAGLPNPAAVPPQAGSNAGFGRNSAWNDNNGEGTPDPTDNLEYLTNYRDSMMFGKKITSSNIRRVVKKYEWVKNNRFDTILDAAIEFDIQTIRLTNRGKEYLNFPQNYQGYLEKINSMQVSNNFVTFV